MMRRALVYDSNKFNDGMFGLNLNGGPVLPSGGVTSAVEITPYFDKPHEVVRGDINPATLFAVENHGDVNGAGELISNEFANFYKCRFQYK